VGNITQVPVYGFLYYMFDIFYRYIVFYIETYIYCIILFFE